MIQILLILVHVWAGPEISVRPVSWVEDSEVTFGDIADIKGFNKDQEKKIKHIVLSNSPGFSEIRKFTSFGISETLRYNLSDFNNVKINIPSEVQVKPTFKKSISNGVTKKIINWILESCPDCNVKIQNLTFPELNVSNEASWELDRTNTIPRGSFTLSLTIADTAQAPQKIWVRGEVRIVKNVPTVKQFLTAGSKLTKDLVQFSERDITFNHDAVPTELEVLGSTLNRSVSANDIIWKSNLKRQYAVLKGQPINLVIQSNQWNVNIKGVSQGNGYVGDLVGVVNPISNRIIQGRILDDSTVEVKE